MSLSLILEKQAQLPVGVASISKKTEFGANTFHNKTHTIKHIRLKGQWELCFLKNKNKPKEMNATACIHVRFGKFRYIVRVEFLRVSLVPV